MKLNQQQIDFLLTLFTGPNDLPGISAISRQLLTDGCCIVAGNGRHWNGGVGNFISSEEVPTAVGCTMLRLNLEGLLSSPWLREYIGICRLELLEQAEKLDHEIGALGDLLSQSNTIRDENNA
jgi:hypothetical protein